MTMSQKILAAHAQRNYVAAGELIEAKVDLVLGNDITSPVAIKQLMKKNIDSVFNNEKIALVMDHFTPNKDIKAAEQCKFVRDFAISKNIKHFYDVGEMGIEHVLLPEKGLVAPGELIIGADSHTCTYGGISAFSTGVGSTDMAAAMITGKTWLKVPSAIRFELSGTLQKYVSGKDVILHIIGMIGVDGALYKSMEFTGCGVHSLTVEDRFCIANMAIESGAKNGIFEPDEITREFIESKTERGYKLYFPDSDAYYDKVIEIDLSKIRPTVAFPHLPENTRTIDEVPEIKIDQVIIGSCTNGRIEDLRAAAEILKGHKVNTRTIIIPATNKIYLDAIEEGLIKIFIESGCVVSTPTCGPCLGGHMGILAKGEKCVATTNRNFVGRMGDTASEIYLASPAVAAASAVKGYIANPENI